LATVIDKAVAKRHKNRFQDATELSSALLKVI
jgi:hypothetical protein